MPTKARANRTDGDAEAGAAEAEKCKKARVTLPVLSVLQTVLQQAFVEGRHNQCRTRR